jgi:hypothetical protein
MARLIFSELAQTTWQRLRRMLRRSCPLAALWSWSTPAAKPAQDKCAGIWVWSKTPADGLCPDRATYEATFYWANPCLPGGLPPFLSLASSPRGCERITPRPEVWQWRSSCDITRISPSDAAPCTTGRWKSPKPTIQGELADLSAFSVPNPHFACSSREILATHCCN